MKRPLGRVAVAVGAGTAALGIAVVPASANPSTVWTVSPPAAGFTAVNSGNITMTFNIPVTCTASSASGTLTGGNGNPAKVGSVGAVTIGTITSPCSTILGNITITATTPWSIVAQDYDPSTGVTTGHVGDISAKAVLGACFFTVAGKASSSYDNSTGVLAVNSVPGELTVASATNCGTLVTTSTKPTFKGDYLVKVKGTSTVPKITGSHP
ncbi:hypothetical protein [Streptomyces sp. SID10815]|uniref:hypothetical protein n=1 Tax=Streptomyces sp. SID10815 TaxID=2706027 RepID=UPI0013C5663A|nr:hypothetical protein [Streptomyces sp. SID10815]NEA47245.1 hypothetical protein [Streptomyces sp. SID10815]